MFGCARQQFRPPHRQDHVKEVHYRYLISGILLRNNAIGPSATTTSRDGTALVETDLRAHVCPTRRNVIAAAAHDLAARLCRACPACGRPGWGVVDVAVGVPCGWCGLLVGEPSAHVEGCASCSHRVTVPIVADDVRADPARCPSCNP